MRRISIIGGGAAGTMCACLLAEAGFTSVELFEAGDALLRKVAATGNGRCNFTNKKIGASHYTGGSYEFASEILEHFDSEAAQEMFYRLGVPAVALESGMVYPHTMSARSLCDALETRLKHAEIKVRLNTKIVRIEKPETAGPYRLFDEQGKAGEFETVILATGGAFGIGRDERSEGYRLATELGHTMTRLHPGIVALRVVENDICKRLRGLRCQVALTVLDGETEEKADSAGFREALKGLSAKELERISFRDEVLFADYGISGIAALKASNLCLDLLAEGKRCSVELDFYPDMKRKKLAAYLRCLCSLYSARTAEEVLCGMLPEGLAVEVLRSVGVDPGRGANRLSDEEIELVSHAIKHFRLHVTGPRKKDHGQVTCGGINTEEVDPVTLESRLRSGLFFMGEMLDVQGRCGGYNLHWAWASAARVTLACIGRRAQTGRNTCFE